MPYFTFPSRRRSGTTSLITFIFQLVGKIQKLFFTDIDPTTNIDILEFAQAQNVTQLSFIHGETQEITILEMEAD
jgi:hypothetical protein